MSTRSAQLRTASSAVTGSGVDDILNAAKASGGISAADRSRVNVVATAASSV
jgi:hypothetical protein